MNTSTSTVILKAHFLGKTLKYGADTLSILKDVNLDIRTGESVAILGGSGSGKTTLISLLAGLDTPTHGTIELFQKPLHTLSDEEKSELRLRHIGFVFQSFKLIHSLNAIENIMLPLEFSYTQPSIAKKQALEWIGKVGLSHRATHYPHQLSGGEQQRVAIARALITHPTLIFADEMTGNLDTETGAHILDLVFSLNSELDTTLILVTHDADIAHRCQRKFTLKNGMVFSC